MCLQRTSSDLCSQALFNAARTSALKQLLCISCQLPCCGETTMNALPKILACYTSSDIASTMQAFVLPYIMQ